MANHIQLVMYEGFLGSDPEMRYTPSGKAVVNFSIGSSRGYTNAAGEQVKETTWVRVTAWGKLGEIINDYCAKGSHVIVTGRLTPDENGRPRVFEGKNGPASSFDVTASEVRIIKGKDGGKVDGGFGSSDEEEFPF